MEVFIARQPIFDRRMQIYGYELLYRKGEECSFSGMDDDMATAELLYNSLLVMGLDDLTDGSVAFINFSKKLVDSEVPYMLPQKNVVIEVLERGRSTRTVVDACNKLREQGYTVALDDFVMDENFYPLIGCVDLIKVEYPSVSIPDQKKLIGGLKGRVKFLAEKVETREEYQQALSLGYDYFQGYFFRKPVTLNSREIVSFDANLFLILKELEAEEPDFGNIAAVIGHDVGLTYKLMKLANSVAAGARRQINSIRQALAFLGIRELRQWAYLMMLKGLRNPENDAALDLSVQRARLMELLAGELGREEDKEEYFLTGMFSLVDVLINRPMERVLEGLPLSERCKAALLGEDNDLSAMLRDISGLESGMNPSGERSGTAAGVGADRYMELYVNALRWAKSVHSL